MPSPRCSDWRRSCEKRCCSPAGTSAPSLPLYCTAVGKVFLADLDREQAIKCLQHIELKARTAQTIGSAQELLEALTACAATVVA